MLKWHGVLGILLIIFAELNFFAEIQPFALWYIPIVWWGYILVVDSLIYAKTKKSPLTNDPKEVLKWALMSVVFWLPLEGLNLFSQNWIYWRYTPIVHLVDFTIIFTGVWMTYHLIQALGLFKEVKLPFKFKFTRTTLILSVLAGLILMWGPVLLPYYLFWGMWMWPFLIFDPINFKAGRPSLIGEIVRGRVGKIFSLIFAPLICGFFWEFWNYFAYPKWFYNIPILHDLGFMTPFTTTKIFEMYLVGYLGYIPFGLSLFAMYYFAEGVLKKSKPS